jgi:hypothetical protein
MHVAYGPPGHKGVTHLVAIGADELDDPSSKDADRAITTALVGSVAIAGLGMLLGSSTLRTAGGGATLALALVRMWTRQKTVVEVTRPAPVSAWW